MLNFKTRKSKIERNFQRCDDLCLIESVTIWLQYVSVLIKKIKSTYVVTIISFLVLLLISISLIREKGEYA